MISYIRHNSVFDLGSRTGASTCTGLYAELDDIYSKYINPQVRVQYDNTDCLCNMSGKQTLDGGSHAFVFHNGSISVTVDEQDNVTIADSGSGGGGGVMVVNVTGTADEPVIDKTFSEISNAFDSGKSVFALFALTGLSTPDGKQFSFNAVIPAVLSENMVVGSGANVTRLNNVSYVTSAQLLLFSTDTLQVRYAVSNYYTDTPA